MGETRAGIALCASTIVSALKPVPVKKIARPNTKRNRSMFTLPFPSCRGMCCICPFCARPLRGISAFISRRNVTSHRRTGGTFLPIKNSALKSYARLSGKCPKAVAVKPPQFNALKMLCQLLIQPGAKNTSAKRAQRVYVILPSTKEHHKPKATCPTSTIALRPTSPLQPRVCA